MMKTVLTGSVIAAILGVWAAAQTLPSMGISNSKPVESNELVARCRVEFFAQMPDQTVCTWRVIGRDIIIDIDEHPTVVYHTAGRYGESYKIERTEIRGINREASGNCHVGVSCSSLSSEGILRIRSM